HQRVARAYSGFERRGGGAGGSAGPTVAKSEVLAREIGALAVEIVLQLVIRPRDPRGQRLVAPVEQRDRPVAARQRLGPDLEHGRADPAEAGDAERVLIDRDEARVGEDVADFGP